ncbi:hypothetical protein FF011L_10560 [Roseimaritima multifibrata]|uniref:Uncharacterized protein n=1 Tax=Roseimaritima multifibrata TaxID=1930274 RepID=A0A517MBP4_9BACT|nr:hypothetical protein FF011L_10560 [Roseimaritima multifibrata]
MSIDMIHIALGVAFVGIWILVGQILVADHQPS